MTMDQTYTFKSDDTGTMSFTVNASGTMVYGSTTITNIVGNSSAKTLTFKVVGYTTTGGQATVNPDTWYIFTYALATNSSTGDTLTLTQTQPAITGTNTSVFILKRQ